MMIGMVGVVELWKNYRGFWPDPRGTGESDCHAIGLTPWRGELACFLLAAGDG